MPKIVIDKFLINYEKIGQGPEPVVFLHGWGTNGASFTTAAQQLTRANPNLSIYLIDLPGFGESNFPMLKMTVSDYADTFKKILAKLQISPKSFIGHSFGGRVLIKYFSKNQIGAKLILTGAAGVAERSGGKNSIYKILAKVGKVIFSLPGLRKWRDKAQLSLYRQVGNDDYLKAGQLKETFKLVVSEDLSSNAMTIKEKTLLIWGADDDETPLAEGKKLNSLISGSKLEVLSPAGHYAFKDQPERFCEMVLEFIK